MGRYRENVFRMALAANALPYPRFGTFAYSNQTNSLVIYETLPAKDLRGDQVAEFIAPFVQKAIVWKQAIEKGEIPQVNAPSTSSRLDRHVRTEVKMDISHTPAAKEWGKSRD